MACSTGKGQGTYAQVCHPHSSAKEPEEHIMQPASRCMLLQASECCLMNSAATLRAASAVAAFSRVDAGCADAGHRDMNVG